MENEIQVDQSARDTALLVYVLQAASFLVGVTFIAGVIVNYLKKSSVVGTWLESHFRWQIRTFWFSVLWLVIGVLTTPIFIGFIILGVNAIWVIYRIVRGWMTLSERKPMYQPV